MWYLREGGEHNNNLSCLWLESQTLGIEIIFNSVNGYPRCLLYPGKDVLGWGRTENSQIWIHYCIHRQCLGVNQMLPGTDLVLKEGAKKLCPWMQVFVIFSWTSIISRTFSSAFTRWSLPVGKRKRNHMGFCCCFCSFVFGKKCMFYHVRSLIQDYFYFTSFVQWQPQQRIDILNSLDQLLLGKNMCIPKTSKSLQEYDWWWLILEWAFLVQYK